MTFFSFNAPFGKQLLKRIPNVKGKAKITLTVQKTSVNEIVKLLNNSLVGSYDEAIRAKLIGVIITAESVVIAVILTDKATLPLASDDIKLEMFPPGQAATKNIPNAKLGKGRLTQINRIVTNGSKIS